MRAYEISSGIEGALKAAPGFIAHAGAAGADGVTVTKLWAQEADWRQFFEANIKPNLPPSLPAPEVAAAPKVMLG